MTVGSTSPPIILICGIPASGKTEYGCWLEQEKGFIHFDIEKNAPKNTSLRQLLSDAILNHSAVSFVEYLRNIRQPVVIDWGFPPELHWFMHLLQQEGVKVWWFDGDREAARQSFTRRGTVSVDALNIQMNLIHQHWSDIQALIGSHIINTVKPGPMYMSCQEIFELMLERNS